MSTHIKICGITTSEDAQMAIEMGAQALGFNFYSQSPRYVCMQTAAAIKRTLPSFVEVVGVFVNTALCDMIRIQQHVGFDTFQLHGDEPLSAHQSLPFPIIKAYRPHHDGDLNTILACPENVTVLLDAPSGEHYGGTGKLANWSLAKKLARQRRLILAGGLTADNVAAAIQQVRPHMVDVCSGVERHPGQKSRTKMQAFFDAVLEVTR